MSIWNYQGNVKDKHLIDEGLYFSDCIFCKTNLITLRDDSDFPKNLYRLDPDYFSGHIYAAICPTCGWWKVSGDASGWEHGEQFNDYYGAIASLRDLDLTDISTPLEEVRKFLIAKYKARFDLHPRLFEETVASVFRGLGYYSRVTAYSGDGGIDVILEGQDNKEIGVQVKRYRSSICVEQIRSFAGALLIEGYTKGIFITTSHFQSGAGRVAARAALKGIQIELIDADKFFDALKITQLENYEMNRELFLRIAYTPLVLLERMGDDW